MYAGGVLTFTVILFQGVTAERETHRFIKVQDGVNVYQDIVHEKDENTVTITVTQTPGLKYLRPTVNYHDFNTKYVAFKDIERGLCLLSLAPIPFATPELYRMGKTNITLALKASFDQAPLSSEEVASIAGKKIQDFCGDYTTLRMYLKHTTETQISRRAAQDDEEPCVLLCFWCLVDGSALPGATSTFVG